MPAPTSIDQLQVGGQGIRLMRKFAGSLAYQRLPGGNRLTIGFALPALNCPDANCVIIASIRYERPASP